MVNPLCCLGVAMSVFVLLLLLLLGGFVGVYMCVSDVLLIVFLWYCQWCFYVIAS